MYRLIPDDMACFINDDPYRTCARSYGITQLNNGRNHLVYTPDPSTSLANLCGFIAKHTKVKEEEKPREKEPTDFTKLTKYGLIHCTVFAVIVLVIRYYLKFSTKKEDQKTVALWLFSSMVFIIYCMASMFFW